MSIFLVGCLNIICQLISVLRYFLLSFNKVTGNFIDESNAMRGSLN